MNAQLTAAWQDIYDGNRMPEEVFIEVSESIRDTMAQERIHCEELSTYVSEYLNA